MKQGIVAGLVAMIVAVVGLFVVTPTAHASVQDFYFSEFQAYYYLSKDGAGRSSMITVEQLTAQFPNFDQNKGIVRAIPWSYDGHSVSLDFNDASLTRNGQREVVYEKQRNGDYLEVSTGTEAYRQGPQTYRYSYTLRDVTKDFGDHQELYWDVNGLEWKQSFDSVVAHVTLDPSIEQDWTNQVTCYQGVVNSRESCAMTQSTDSKGRTVLTFASSRGMAVGENLTIVVGFKTGTFQPYSLGPTDILIRGVLAGLVVVAIASLVWTIIVYARRGRNAPGRGTIIPEYLPPKDVSVLLASNLYPGQTNKAVAAQIVDLAVRHAIQIVEYDQKRLFGTKKAYKLVFLTEQGLTSDELQFISVFFPELVKGEEYDMADTTVAAATGMKLSKFTTDIATMVISREFRRKFKGRYLPFVIGVATTALAIFIGSQDVAAGSWLVPLAIVTSAATSGVQIILLVRQWPLTEKGAALRDYVKGLEMYIKVAEEERLKILQSVEGAERKAMGDVAQPANLVKLYERVLPYAILLGLEKSWAKVLEQYYDAQVSPSWYVGTGAFSVSSFSSSLTSFAASTSSSSSGFSGGGGSGGGGGGGGGGGR